MKHHFELLKAPQLVVEVVLLKAQLMNEFISKMLIVCLTRCLPLQVERVEIKDVRLPVALQRAMAAEAEATREARAKVGNVLFRNL